MLSRIKDAIDRSMTEDQARHKTVAEQRAANSSTGTNTSTSTNGTGTSPSTNSSKTSSQEGTRHPDPAVFEAAIRPENDSEGASRSATPKPSVSAENTKGKGLANTATEKNGSARGQNGDTSKAAGVDASQTDELPPDVRTKLRRLERLEPNFNEVLRSYRIAHTQIKNFERTLQEHTPLSTIKDPDALLEYIRQFDLKNDMTAQELNRVSAERNDLKKRVESSEAEFATLKSEMATLKEAAKTAVDESLPNEADKGPAKDGKQEDMFSYDDEFAGLRADLALRNEEIAKLELQIDTSKKELAVAREQITSTSRDAQKANDAEITSLKATLEDKQKQLQDNEARLEKERSLHASKTAKIESLEAENKNRNTEFEKLSEEQAQMAERIASLNSQLEEYKKTNAATGLLELTHKAAETTASTNASARKKNKKKKKKGGASSTVAETAVSETSETMDPTSLEVSDAEALKAEISALQESLAIVRKEKAELLEKMANQKEDMETLEQSAIENGQDAATAKTRSRELEEKIMALQGVNREEKTKIHAAFKTLISDLEKEGYAMELAYLTLEGFVSESEEQMETDLEQRAKLVAAQIVEPISKSKVELESIKKQFEEGQIQLRALSSDLGASQKLAQDRFKELTNVKEILAKAQPEMRSLRQDSSALEKTRKELTTKENEYRALEKREKDLKNEVSRVQRLSSDRESEIKLLNDRLSAEKTSRVKLEDEKRIQGRDFRRLEAEKTDIIAKAEKTSLDLEAAQFELSSLRPKAKTLEDDVARLQKEMTIAKEEINLRTQQYQSAQGLLASMRAENKELETQLKEAQIQAESFQEELIEAQKHLSERTRETETMRRRIKEENEKADSRVRDMRAQMEAAIEERDRIEDETSTLGRQRAREAEELKIRVRELEHESKALKTEKDALEASERQWRQRREELEQIEEKATAETEDMRSTVSSLRSALDASEQQVRDTEKQKSNLRKLLEEAQSRYERTTKELKNVQSKLNPGNASTGTAKSGVDIAYLKTVFLQFLNTEDVRVRQQLIPIILRLLEFDGSEQEKGTKTLQEMLKSNRK